MKNTLERLLTHQFELDLCFFLNMFLYFLRMKNYQYCRINESLDFITRINKISNRILYLFVNKKLFTQK
jgi:hypothetical protein